MGEQRKGRGLQELLDDFVLLDCRLGDHPDIAAAVSYREGDAVIRVAATGRSSPEIVGREFPREISLADHVIKAGRYYLVDDLPERSSRFDDLDRRSVRTVLAFPLFGQDYVFGALTLAGVTPGVLREQTGRAQLLAA